MVVGGLASPSSAGTVAPVSDYLNRQVANATSGISHQVFFTPTTNLPGTVNTVDLRFASNQQGQWCRLAGTLSVIGLTDPTGATELATALPGSLTAACTANPGGDTLTVSGVGPLVAGTRYGYQLTENTGHLGTAVAAMGIVASLVTTNGGGDVDAATFPLSTLASDQILVSATVIGTTPPVNTNPTVTFNGLAAPAAQIVVNRNGLQIGTVTAGGDATFSLTLADQPTGAVVYDITATDADGRALSPLTFALTLALNTTTIVNGVFLGPSIGLDATSVKIGTPVTVFGTTAPGSRVTLSVHSSPLSLALTSDASGQWSTKVNTTAIGVGSHSAQAQAVFNGTAVSQTSALVSFAVNPLGLFDGKPPADLNGDGRVNIIDFSIMLYFWNQSNPANGRADINHDGRVDLTDFSILLFQWTN